MNSGMSLEQTMKSHGSSNAEAKHEFGRRPIYPSRRRGIEEGFG